ncbi:M23 family metallopeptidase [Paenibacillus sp. JTLBN-2024]
MEHPNGLQTWYMHLSKLQVKEGDSVDKGEQIRSSRVHRPQHRPPSSLSGRQKR